MHSAVHGRRGRLAARRRHRQSGATHTLSEGRADAGDERRRTRLCVARRRHHLHGRRYADAGRCLRLCPDAGAGRADRVHDAAFGLCGAWRLRGLCEAACFDQGERRGSSDAARPRTARMKRLPQISLLPDGKRLYLQDGPIDLIVEAKASASEVRTAYEAAAQRFTGLLDELCEELVELRKAAESGRTALKGVVARRMHAAVTPFAAGCFITPMAAVAG